MQLVVVTAAVGCLLMTLTLPAAQSASVSKTTQDATLKSTYLTYEVNHRSAGRRHKRDLNLPEIDLDLPDWLSGGLDFLSGGSDDQSSNGDEGSDGQEKISLKDRVGGWLDTVGEWANKTSKITGPVSDIMDTAVKVRDLFAKHEQAKWEQDKAEREFDLKVEDLCNKICVTEWSHWSACTQRCGGGVRRRQRQHIMPGSCARLGNFACPYSTLETAPCNPGCANGGRSSGSGSCSCRTGFEGDCCDNDVICRYPGKPTNSRIEEVQIPAKYGTRLVFMCNTGFAITGGQDEMICGADGSWNGQKPDCTRVTCSKPTSPAHGRVLNSQSVFPMGEEVEYMCEDGYRLRGPVRRRCVAFDGSEGRWNGFTPVCEEINCGDPEQPQYGEMIGTNFKLGGTVTFQCMTGFRLLGSEERTCLPNGKWSGHPAECQEIQCEQPQVPKFGRITRPRDSYHYHTTVIYECETGYQLVGAETRECVQDEEWGILGPGGKWDQDMPKCVGAICEEEPSEPENGAKDGSVYYYPYNVTFTCFAGHVLHGLNKIMCDRSGQWSGAIPTCTACVEGTYKPDTNVDTGCLACPPNTNTVTTGSTSLQQCLCNQGFRRTPDGQCEEVICPELTAPDHGSISECGNRLDDSCDFFCEDGYILEHGSSRRTCMEDGDWTGSAAVCNACEENTYKADERSCYPCPRNSHTPGTGHMRDACTCDSGFTGPAGGPCYDSNECSNNNGLGPCQEHCRNTIGGYTCDCMTPGYVVDPYNNHLCLVDQTCRNLTEDDAPENGGLVCHWYIEENSQQCSVRCNPGHSFPDWVNNYETCGLTSEFLWSFEKRGEIIPPCTEEFFPDYNVGANTTYFVRECRSLTEEEKNQVKEEFAKTLTDQGICMKSELKVCDMKNVGIICGSSTTRRRRRGVDEEVQEVSFNFDLHAFMFGNKSTDCELICKHLKIPASRCDKLCIPVYKRFLKAAVTYGKAKLSAIFRSNLEKVQFQSANRNFEPKDDALETTDVMTGCGEGMKALSDTCEPCPAGSHYNPADNVCVPCGLGTYQPESSQVQCLPCALGTTTIKPGSTQCTVCAEGWYGQMCSRTCDCSRHGRCDPQTGQCRCSSGWTGDRCDTDIPGCQDDSCYPGVHCRDIPAPGTGFRCGPCPPGMIGDGARCEPS